MNEIASRETKDTQCTFDINMAIPKLPGFVLDHPVRLYLSLSHHNFVLNIGGGVFRGKNSNLLSLTVNPGG